MQGSLATNLPRSVAGGHARTIAYGAVRVTVTVD
jgi:hypothetical protein